MAKKHRQRVWYVALLKEDADKAFLHRKLPVNTVLFDKEFLALGYASSKRMTPQRDVNGEYILDENGYAQLPSPEKITVIGIKGRAIDWKQVDKAPKNSLAHADIHGDFIKLNYDIRLNKQTLDIVLEESDEAYEKFISSPLAQAGHNVEKMKKTAEQVVEELKKDVKVTAEDNLLTT